MFLRVSLRQPDLDITPFMEDSTSISLSTGGGMAALSPETPIAFDYLQRPQQEYFLELFWQGPHCIYPIINEAEFREHFETLWPSPGSLKTHRNPSPL